MRNNRRIGYTAILLFGIVSMFGDIIYEGARGSLPSFLKFLGASATIVGITFGISEFLGYALRLVSGVLADTTRAYWAFYFIGYGLIISIPILGFVNVWYIAIILIVIERLAKAFRSPARDTLISFASKDVGAGKAFGLHELLDQVGAIIGPGIVASILYFTGNNYSKAYVSMFFPYIILLLFVFYVYKSLRGKIIIYKEKHSLKFSSLPRGFWFYILAVSINTMGLIHISLILYVASKLHAPYFVTILYLIMQAVDAVSAPISGYIYDKYGRGILIFPFILSVIPSILTVLGRQYHILLSIILFGIIYGMQESIYRAAISDLISMDIRGTAYGIFNTMYGLGFLFGGAVYGILIEMSLVNYAIIYAIITQTIAISSLLYSIKVKEDII